MGRPTGYSIPTDEARALFVEQVLESNVYKDLKRFCVFLSYGTPLDSDDILQDTLIQAYRFYSLFEQGSNLQAWLFVVARNITRNLLHRGELRGRDKVTPENKLGFMTMEMFADDGAPDGFSDTVENVLREMDDRYRTVLLLAGVEDMQYDEMAVFLGIPIGTVRSRLHRAREEFIALYKRRVPTFHRKGHAHDVSQESSVYPAVDDERCVAEEVEYS